MDYLFLGYILWNSWLEIKDFRVILKISYPYAVRSYNGIFVLQ